MPLREGETPGRWTLWDLLGEVGDGSMTLGLGRRVKGEPRRGLLGGRQRSVSTTPHLASAFTSVSLSLLWGYTETLRPSIPAASISWDLRNRSPMGPCYFPAEGPSSSWSPHSCSPYSPWSIPGTLQYRFPLDSCSAGFGIPIWRDSSVWHSLLFDSHPGLVEKSASEKCGFWLCHLLPLGTWASSLTSLSQLTHLESELSANVSESA